LPIYYRFFPRDCIAHRKQLEPCHTSFSFAGAGHSICCFVTETSTSCQMPKDILNPCCAFPHTRITAVHTACRSVRQRCDSIGCKTSTSLCLRCLIVAEVSRRRSVAVLSAVSMNVSTFADHPASRMFMLSRAKESRLRVEEYFPL